MDGPGSQIIFRRSTMNPKRLKAALTGRSTDAYQQTKLHQDFSRRRWRGLESEAPSRRLSFLDRDITEAGCARLSQPGDQASAYPDPRRHGPYRPEPGSLCARART